MTPHEAGRPRRKASSPKSLSKVSRVRPSAEAMARTSLSGSPGLVSAMAATFGGVCQAGLDVFLDQVRIVVENLLGGPTGGQEVYDELDGEPGAFDDWLADEDVGVDGDAVLPVHYLKISIPGGSAPGAATPVLCSYRLL